MHYCAYEIDRIRLLREQFFYLLAASGIFEAIFLDILCLI